MVNHARKESNQSTNVNTTILLESEARGLILNKQSSVAHVGKFGSVGRPLLRSLLGDNA